MILYLVWAPTPTASVSFTPAKPQRLVVDYAHPVPGWLEYRKTGDRTVHWVPQAALREAWTEPRPGDPDPMHQQEALQ